MKRIAIALLATAAALAASSARAQTHVRIGVNVGAPVYRHAPVVVAHQPAVVYAPPPALVYAPPPAVVVVPPRGYWKEIQVKTWVPERWVVRHNRWGRAERHCEPGYYTYTTQRQWVEDRHDHHRGHAYGHDRDHRNRRGHGYGHDRDDRGYSSHHRNGHR